MTPGAATESIEVPAEAARPEAAAATAPDRMLDELVAASRARQGLPPRIADRATLARLARLIRQANA
jgi:hypothetical protein